jgi:hypothetical protein
MNTSGAPEYQVNQPGASLDIDGAQGGPYYPSNVSRCTGAIFTINFNSTAVGQPWDVAISPLPLVPASGGALQTLSGQIVNVNLTAVTLLNGGFGATFVPLAIPAAFGAPADINAQMAVLDPANPDLISISQPVHLVIQGFSLPPTPIPGPTLDDSQVTISVGCARFFGLTFNTITVQSNGRIMFGGGNTSYTPSPASFATQPASFGIWTDLNPATGGTITINSGAPGLIDVAYSSVNYFGTTIPNTFNLLFDNNIGIASIVGLTGLGTSGSQMLIGISGGTSVGATDPGAVNFSPGGMGTLGSTSNGTDMVYATGTQGSVTTGINRIDFYPNFFNNYDWISQ